MSALQFAPPPKTVDGFYAVPVRLASVTASFSIDAETKAASASAEMAFTLGPDAGYPVFDLRQGIATATLDGAAVAVAEIAVAVIVVVAVVIATGDENKSRLSVVRSTD